MIPLLYGIVSDYGRNGRALNEVCLETASKENVILQIIRGDYGGTLLEIWCLDRDCSSLTDASEDIARDVLHAAAELGETLSAKTIDWIEDKLGLVRGVA